MEEKTMKNKNIIMTIALCFLIISANGVKASADSGLCNYGYTQADTSGSVTGNQSQNHNGNGGSGGSKPQYVYKAPIQNGSYEHPYKYYHIDGYTATESEKFSSFYNNNSNGSNVVLDNTGYTGAIEPTYSMQSDGTCLVTYKQWFAPDIIGSVTTTSKNATLTDVLDHYVWGRAGVEPLAEFNSGSSSYDFTPTAVGQTSVHCHGVRRHVEGYWKDKNGNVVLMYNDGHTTNALSKSDTRLNYREETTYINMQREDWDFNIGPAEVGKTINTDYNKPIVNKNENAEAWADTQLIQ